MDNKRKKLKLKIPLNRKKIHEIDDVEKKNIEQVDNVQNEDNPFNEDHIAEKSDLLDEDLNSNEETSNFQQSQPIEDNDKDQNNPFFEVTQETTPDEEPEVEVDIEPDQDINIFDEDNNSFATNDADLVIDIETPYFFVFGNSTAGKSAMLSGLLYYIKTSGIGQLRSLSLNDIEHHRKGDYVLNQMTKLVRKGEFISGTQTLDTTEFVFPTEINLEFEPYERPSMPFCLLEMAGEDLKEIELRDEGKAGGKFDERINAYLQHPECQLIFICVVDVDTPNDSEDLIDQFLNYAHKIGHKNNPVLLTINKWDKVANQYANVKDYIEKELPILKNHLFDTNRDVAYMKFSIGDVISGEPETYKFKSDDSEKLLKWMYQTAKGISLDQEIKSSMLGNFFKSIKNIFSNE